ncbi:MAG: nicotinate (nicotinamide) nucleotide adenylyltransferase [Kiritimatiellae bacterium]|nr:nicotinate (nicotinamide) nucleotide adenylyltransferase [Kiritimatiellia bacterium]
MRKIGIFGGSFNPMHLGHLSVAKAALEMASLNEVIVMPAFVSPFRQKEERFLSDEERLEIARLTCEDVQNLRVSDFEISKKEVSYTFNTVSFIKEQEKDAKLFWIMGEDSLPGLNAWHRAKELFELCDFIVYPRRDAVVRLGENEASVAKDARIIKIQSSFVDVSSTLIREKILNGEDLTGLVHPKVISFLHSKRTKE